MRLLLDTHIVLWWVDGNNNLSEKAKAFIADKSNLCFVSSVSIWEIELKVGIGKLRLPSSFYSELERQDFTELMLNHSQAKTLRELPPLHKDPFDRMLIGQALVENLTILTADKIISSYEVSTLLV